MITQLTDEQRATIARNKAEALKRAAARKLREAQAVANASTSTTTYSTVPQSILNKQANAQSTSNRVPSSSTTSTYPSKPLYQQNTTSTWNTPKHAPSQNISIKSPNVVPLNLPKSDVLVKITIYGPTRLKIQQMPFHNSVLTAVKSVPSRQYDDKDRTWNISVSDFKLCERVLTGVKDVNVKLEVPPDSVMKALSGEEWKAAVPEDLSLVIDPTLISTLFPYQKDGVKFGLERNGRVIIADEMGLGKSLQALTIARYYKLQLNTFLPCIHRIFVIEKGTDPFPDTRTSNTVVIMSYDQMALKHQLLTGPNRYYVVILDECHMLKDGKAKRTQVATEIAKKATRVLLLSGTPALSRPAELFSQVRLVNTQLFPNYHQFAIRYCDGKQGRFCFEAKGCTNSDELTAVLLKRVMIRRLKADVLKDLPDKRREIQVVYLSGDLIDSRMDSLQKAKQKFEENNSRSSNPSVANNDSLLEYYNLTGIVKASSVCCHIVDNYFYPDAPKRKVLIFAHHQIVLDTIHVEVQKRKLRSIRIDGQTPAKDRGELCRTFQEDEDVVVAVLSMTAAGVGITLTAASVVVFAELHWTPTLLMQAEDRAHRVGQKDSVFVQYLVAKKTADDVIWPMIQKKLDVLGQVKLSSENFRNAEKSHKECTDQGGMDVFLQREPKKARLDAE